MNEGRLMSIRLGVSPVKGNLKIGALRTHMINYALAVHKILTGAEANIVLRKDDTNKKKGNDEIFSEIVETFNKHLRIQCTQTDFVSQKNRAHLYTEFLQNHRDNNIIKSDDESLYIDVKEYIALYGNTIMIHDALLGDIIFNVSSMLVDAGKDKIIITRSNGSYLYNFSSPIDDEVDGITHVVRGADKIGNVPYQEIVRTLLGLKEKVYVHVPMLLAPDGVHATFPSLINQGISAKAIVSYMISSIYNSNEPIDIEEFYNTFDLKKVRTKNAFFDFQKLEFIHKKITEKFSLEQFLSDLKHFVYATISDNTIINALLTDSDLLEFLYTERKRNYKELISNASRLINVLNDSEIFDTIQDESLRHGVLNQIKHFQSTGTCIMEGKINFEALRWILTGSSQGLDCKGLYKYAISKTILSQKIVGAEKYLLTH